MSNTKTKPAAETSILVEDAGPCRKRLKFEIPAEQVAERLAGSVGELSRAAALPGFRPGKAPRRLIERRFGDQIRNETKQTLVTEAVTEAVKEHNLQVLGDPDNPEGVLEATLDGTAPFAFSVEVEVAPEFELPDLEGIEVRRPVAEVTDEMIDEQVQRVCTNEGRLEPQEEAEPGDYCVGDGVMTRNSDGETLLDLKGAVIQIPAKDSDGKGMILGVMVDDFAGQVGAPKRGDTITVKTTGPAQHEDERVRSEPLTIEFNVEEAHRIIPATPEELASRMGAPSVDEMREFIRQQLAQRLIIEQQAAMREQIADHLADTIDFETPERLTARQLERNLERTRMELMYRGVDANQIEQEIAEMRDSSAEAVRREMKRFFILHKIAQSMGVQVNDQEINGRIAQMAASRGERPEQVRNDLIRSGRARGLVQQLTEHKTLDAVLSKAKVEDIPVEEYNKQVLARREAAGAGKPAARGGKSKKK